MAEPFKGNSNKRIRRPVPPFRQEDVKKARVGAVLQLTRSQRPSLVAGTGSVIFFDSKECLSYEEKEPKCRFRKRLTRIGRTKWAPSAVMCGSKRARTAARVESSRR